MEGSGDSVRAVAFAVWAKADCVARVVQQKGTEAITCD